jgi:enolase-phosphatase E1
VLAPAGVRVLLLDIEGTTTPIDFVLGTLFPFARGRVRGFLEERGHDPEVRADVALLREEHAREAGGPPAWGEAPEAVAAYVHWLMDRDRKSTGLKSLQGKIWQEGFAGGRLQGQVYADVPRALARWRDQGRRVAIFSSGSVLAQRLLFGSTPHGDLTPWIDAFFDTTSGPKRDAPSYAAIARALGHPAGELLFLSDVAEELDAARDAGAATGLAVRGPEPPPAGHPAVRSFDDVFPGPKP